jgi:FkbM family methyltransferase
MFSKLGQKISRLGDVIQQPRLLSVYMRGIEVRMFENLNKHWLLNENIRTIFDIGANTGQFAQTIHEVLPSAFIYSFEPLPDCFIELERNMKYVRTFKAFNVALDDQEGQSIIYRSEWSPSSSLRPMAQLHKENFPYTAKFSTEEIQVKRLDGYQDELEIEDDILMKLDVQGCEDKVIAGGKQLISRAKILIVETSLEPLYENQPLFRDIFSILDELSFTYRGNLNQMSSATDDRILYVDAIFTRGA